MLRYRAIRAILKLTALTGAAAFAPATPQMRQSANVLRSLTFGKPLHLSGAAVQFLQSSLGCALHY